MHREARPAAATLDILGALPCHPDRDFGPPPRDMAIAHVLEDVQHCDDPWVLGRALWWAASRDGLAWRRLEARLRRRFVALATAAWVARSGQRLAAK